MRWLGPIDRKWSNQNALIAVRIRPLSGTGSSITTSNALIRSEATITSEPSASVVEVANLPRIELGERHPTRSIASKTLPMLRSARSRPKASSSSVGVECHPHVSFEHGTKWLALGAGHRRVLLHDAVGLVASEAGSDEREQHGLAEDEPEREVEVRPHAVRVDVEVVDERGRLAQHVVREKRRVRKDHPLDRRVRDVALVPQAHVFEAGGQVAAQDPSETREAFGGDRVALVRHRGRALLARLEPLLDLRDLGALQVPHLCRDHLDRRTRRRARVQVLGVSISTDHLRCRHRFETECPAHLGLDRGIDVRVSADCTRQLADRDHLAGLA